MEELDRLLNDEPSQDERYAEILEGISDKPSFNEEDFEVKRTDLHENQKNITYFSEEQLRKDPEAKEIEEKLFDNAKPAEHGTYLNGATEVAFYEIDDFGNKIPSMHGMNKFNSFGVNEYGQTFKQAKEEEGEAKEAFTQYSVRRMNLEKKLLELKMEFKDLEMEFKDQGFEVKIWNRTLAWLKKQKDTDPTELFLENVCRAWAIGTKEVLDAYENVKLTREDLKNIGKDKEARRDRQLDNLKQRMDRRYDRDAELGRLAIDNHIEKMAQLASDGVPRAEEDLIRFEESKEIANIRKANNARALAYHDRDIRPTNPREFQRVYGDEYQARLKEKQEQDRLDAILNPKSEDEKWSLDYKPTDVPVTFDFDELVKHGKNQVRKLSDRAHMFRKQMDGMGEIPEKYRGKWEEKFEDLSREQIYRLIALAAKAEDYLECQEICDDVLLKPDDPRRDDWNTHAMRIARWNRLVRVHKITGSTIKYDPQKHDDKAYVFEIPKQYQDVI